MSPMIERGRRWLIPVLALAILVGGFVGVALSGGGANDAARGPRPEKVRWLEHFAEELGVGEEELLAAAQDATEATLDDLVAQRLLTEEQASIIRSRLERAVQNPDAIRRILRSLEQEAAPYKDLVRDVKGAAARALARELGVDVRRVRALARRHELGSALRRAGVSRADVEARVRCAARARLERAVDNGLLTRRQTRIALHKIAAFLDHHQ